MLQQRLYFHFKKHLDFGSMFFMKERLVWVPREKHVIRTIALNFFKQCLHWRRTTTKSDLTWFLLFSFLFDHWTVLSRFLGICTFSTYVFATIMFKWFFGNLVININSINFLRRPYSFSRRSCEYSGLLDNSTASSEYYRYSHWNRSKKLNGLCKIASLYRLNSLLPSDTAHLHCLS